MILPGDIYDVTAAASVQFARGRGFRFRVIRDTSGTSTPTGWAWLDGYVLGADGLATERRTIFVRTGGLIPVATTATRQARVKPTNTSPSGRIPTQRTRTTYRSNR